MGRSFRPWWLALAVSLLLHVSLIGGLAGLLLPQWDSPPEPVPFEARLVSVPKPDTPHRPVTQTLPPAQRTLPQTFHKRLPSQPPESAVEPVVAIPSETESEASTVVAPVDEPAVPAAAIVDAMPSLNALPRRLDLRFQVHYGLATGEQTLQWVDEGGRYTLVSVAEATGLAGMFYRGRFVQTSRGQITSRGLQPEEFWDQRGDKRSSARFDIASGLLTLSPAKGAPRHFAYQGDVQDALSLFFQLALTAPPEGRLTYKVFNGKKLRDYVYEVRGQETLDTALGELRTLHLARVADGDGRFEAWLAIDRHYLPVRVLRSDEKGSEVELRLQSITP